MIKRIICLFVFMLLACQAEATTWEETLKTARGQVVYFNAWGGGKEVNTYIRWAAKEAKSRYGIQLVHVKVTDIADVVSRILAEKTAGVKTGGSVDMMWINGENFKAMKEGGLLFGPFTQNLPAMVFANVKGLNLDKDFTVPVEGLEAPWGVGQLNFIYDAEATLAPPTNARDLLAYAKTHPGRVTYPKPPQFHGSSFLKQVLLDLVKEREPLYHPVIQADFHRVTAPLWSWLDALHPHMWRKAGAFPTGSSQMTQMLDDGEIDLALSFNPQDAASKVKKGLLPKGAQTLVFDIGALTNSHFLAIPYNSSAKEAAQVVINFLLSPEAQARKSDPAIWGDPTILNLDRLSGKEKAFFKSTAALKPGIAEPHPSWMVAIEKEWKTRYGH
ncbi:MAG: ABC transporter substrate-binding protein [Desulfobacterales bacterium]|nr:ABC transporter substrate-binding protein [Desulfobacterales bacterium]